MAVDKLVDSTQLDADLTSVANAIRTRGGTSELLEFPSEFVSAIQAIPSEGGGGSWERPEGWPDLDSIDLTNFEGSYYTYDTSLMPTGGYDSVHLVGTTQNGGDYIVERGHLQNGLFVADDTFTCATNVVFDHPIDVNDGVYQVWRARPVDGEHLTKLMFGTPWQFTYQPCVERVSRLPYVTSLYQDHAYTARWRGINIRREKLVNFNSVTTMNSAFSDCNLECVDIISCDFSGVNSLAATFSGCEFLEYLNILDSHFDNVSTMMGTFSGCFSLIKVDISSIDLSTIRNMTSCFRNCYRLSDIKANWTEMPDLVNMEYTFSGDFSLKNLDLTGLIASNVTSLNRTFESMDLDTLTAPGAFPNNNVKLSYVFSNIKHIIASGWGNTVGSNTLGGTNVVEADFSGWNLTDGVINFNGNGWGSLRTIYPPIQYRSHIYVSAYLTHDSLVRIINALATVEETQTLTIGAINLAKLSADEIAVATEKGWTLA